MKLLTLSKAVAAVRQAEAMKAGMDVEGDTQRLSEDEGMDGEGMGTWRSLHVLASSSDYIAQATTMTKLSWLKEIIHHLQVRANNNKL